MSSIPSKSSPLSPKSTFSSHSSPTSPTDSQSTIIKLRRSQLAQIYLEAHVPQWKDDVLIQSLFANLPNREAKPEAFNQKYSFWKDLIIAMTRERLLSESVFKFPTRDLSNSFKRGGLQPICLNSIINEMQSEGLALDADDAALFNTNRRPSSIVGGIASWLLGSIKSIVSQEDDISSGDGDESRAAKIPVTILIPSLLKEQLLILKEFLDYSPMPLSFDEFHSLINDSRRREGLTEITNKDDIILVLNYFKSEGVLNYAPVAEKFSEDVLLAIKIKSSVNSVDFDIIKLKRLHGRLNSQIEELGDKIRDLNELARRCVQVSNDRKMALYHLKRKALLEKVQLERMNSLHSVDEILLKINSVSDEAMILEAYKIGTKTLKGLLPDSEDVEGTIDQLQEVIADSEEITRAFSQLNPSITEFDEDLEAELKALTEKKLSDLAPKSPLSSEIIDDLTKELGNVRIDPADLKSPSTKTPELA